MFLFDPTTEPLPDWILVGPQARGRRLGNQHRRRPIAVAFTGHEQPPPPQWQTERPGEFRRDKPEVRRRLFGARQCAALGHDEVLLALSAQRAHRRRRRVLDAGNRLDGVQHSIVDRPPRRRIDVPGRRQRHIDSQDPFASESAIQVQQADKAHRQQRCRDEQSDREADLERQQSGAHAKSTPLAGNCGASGAQRVLYVLRGNTPRREDHDGQAGARGQNERGRQHAAVERHVDGSRQVHRGRADEHAQRDLGHPHAENPARRREQTLLHCRPHYETAPTGAKSRANRGVAEPADRPRQRQVRQVRTGNQQNGQHGRQQYKQSLPGSSGNTFCQGRHDSTERDGFVRFRSRNGADLLLQQFDFAARPVQANSRT